MIGLALGVGAGVDGGAEVRAGVGSEIGEGLAARADVGTDMFDGATSHPTARTATNQIASISRTRPTTARVIESHS
jgi:hypothetical protein